MTDKETEHEPGFPLNRIVAFAGPQISWVAGVIATWLITHVHILGLDHFGHDQTAKAIASVLTFIVVTLVTWLGQHKWLDGWQKWETGMLVQTDPAPLTGPQDIDTEITDENLNDVSSSAGVPTDPIEPEAADIESGQTRSMPLGWEQGKE